MHKKAATLGPCGTIVVAAIGFSLKDQVLEVYAQLVAQLDEMHELMGTRRCDDQSDAMAYLLVWLGRGPRKIFCSVLGEVHVDAGGGSSRLGFSKPK